MNTRHTARWLSIVSTVVVATALQTGCVAELDTADANGSLDGLTDDAAGDEKAIVGGVDVAIAQNPWQISLQSDGFHFCGGSIIGDSWVLTAQHCIDGEVASRLKVVAGTTRLSRPQDGQTRQVAQIIPLPGYRGADRGKDLALLRLSQPLTLGGSVQAIGFATDADNATTGGTVATVTGWGTLRSGGSSPDTLKGVAVPVVELATAQRAYRETLTADQLAAGGNGRDSCQGDSGGPLTADSARGRILIGVVSWGYGCGDPGVAGMYARVPFYASWITQQTGLTSTPSPSPSPSALADQDVSGGAGSVTHIPITVPAGTTRLDVTLDGASGDADLYVRFGSQPTTSSWDCRPYTATSHEACAFDNPPAGTWYVSVRGYSAYDAARITAIAR